MPKTLLLYGASGYTGELIARRAVQEGLKPILAGRNLATLTGLANELDLPTRAFDLRDPIALAESLVGVHVVLNCAGPFALTAASLAQGCIRAGVHYLDLAGEVPEFQRLADCDEAACQAGVMLLPGVGFGVVPSDGLALHLKKRLPEATELALAFQAQGGVSRGTLITTLKDLPHAGVIRVNGQLVSKRAGSETRLIDFGQGSQVATLNPWRGDIFTAYYSTGIPSIKTYTVYPAALRLLMSLSGPLKGLFSSSVFQGLIKSLAQGQPAGPGPQQRAQGKTVLWGEARTADGQRVAARLVGPEAYDFTVLTALLIARRVLAGEVLPGFHTPAQVYGADLVLSLPGIQCIDEV